MQKEIPKPDASPRPNGLLQIAWAAGALAVLALSMALSLRPAHPEQSSGGNYDNFFSRSQLAASKMDVLVIVEPGKNELLPAETIFSWSQDVPQYYTPQAHTSLLQYFYEQIGTPHPWAGYESGSAVRGLAFNEQILGAWVLEKSQSLTREPQNAELVIENGLAIRFQPDLGGYTTVPSVANSRFKVALFSPAEEFVWPLSIKEPRVKLAALNDLGITERIAVGQSDFTGSSAARINNIRVGAARYNGIILAAGEEFSFNKYLGPVDAAHGFKPELVIKPEGATPEFGGGLCQVSTTAFRAAFFGGLPITQRRNHSYAVKYYEWIADDLPRAVGLDATIYAPYQDMKFLNDTPSALLIWTRMEAKRLYFDFYGTPDGRQVAVDGPHPFDKRPSGAVKSTVSRTVTKDGQSADITFNSVYIPPKVAEQSFELPASPTDGPAIPLLPTN